MLRDLGRDDPAISAIIAVLNATAPDIVLLTDFDHDHDGLALAAFAARAGYAHFYGAAPNTGRMTALDLDQNGRTGEPRDAQGYGRFTGDGGMALLSRWPINTAAVQDFSALLWRDLPGATLPEGWPEQVNAIQRLSHAGHWNVPVEAPEGEFNLLVFAAGPPVFDGPEDRNGLRNRDELRLLTAMLDGIYGPAPTEFVILGNANLDPVDGDGLHDAIAGLLADPRLNDPLPQSKGGHLAADADQRGDPALDTVDWPDGRPGNLRVSYVLPGRTWTIREAGVFWPAPDDPDAALLGEDGLRAGPHRLVWVDIAR